MLIPIGHENSEVRRIPWVTIVIMALCFLVHLYVNSELNRMERQVKEAVNDYIRSIRKYNPPFRFQPPDIQKLSIQTLSGHELPIRFAQYDAPPEDDREEFFNPFKKEQDEKALKAQQEAQEKLKQRIEAIIKDNVFMKYGYIPANKNYKAIFTCIFIHGGWWHLIFNMLFLFLSGPFIEDVWGKMMYAVFYILSGVVATMIFAMHSPKFEGPLVGASGAIAGAMGAFLIRYYKTKIKFLFLGLWGFVFHAPAWLMLPLWLINEFTNAKAQDVFNADGAAGGVAHWAHIGGFVFGITIAILLKLFQFEERVITPKVLKETTYIDKNFKAFNDAKAAIESGDSETGYIILMDAVKADPTFKENIELLWNLSVETGREAQTAPFLAKVVERDIRNDQMHEAVFYYGQLVSRGFDVPLTIQSRIKMAEYYLNQNDSVTATELAIKIINEISPASPPGILVEAFNMAVKFDFKGDFPLKNKILEMCLAHPDIPEARKNEFKAHKSKGIIRVDASTYGEESDLSGAGFGMAAGMAAGMTQTRTTFSNSPQSLPGVQPPPIPSTFPESNNGGYNPSPGMQPPTPGMQSPPPLPPEAMSPYSSSEQSYEIETTGSKSRQPQPGIQPPPIPSTFPESNNGGHNSSPGVQPPPGIQSPGPAKEDGVFLDLIPLPLGPLPPIKLNITEVAPQEIKEGKMTMEAPGVGQRQLSLDRVKGIAVTKIAPPNERPFLIIDLFLTPIESTASEFRIIRLSSMKFNPQKYFPNAKTVLEAFRLFSNGLMKLTGAKPFPDVDSVLLKKAFTFASIENYNDALASLNRSDK